MLHWIKCSGNVLFGVKHPQDVLPGDVPSIQLFSSLISYCQTAHCLVYPISSSSQPTVSLRAALSNLYLLTYSLLRCLTAPLSYNRSVPPSLSYCPLSHWLLVSLLTACCPTAPLSCCLLSKVPYWFIDQLFLFPLANCLTPIGVQLTS
jgi:hypothetical protein